MSEEPTEFDKAEFDSIARELREDTYATIGKSITAWSTTESILVTIATMLLDTRPEKAGLVLYSINNFHTWLSIIEELFAIDPQFTPLRPEWIAISNRLRKLNDTRVSLAHHALGPGKGFKHFVETDNDDLSGIFPTLRPDSSDTRTKSKKHTPIGLEQLSEFIHELATTQKMMATLIDRMLPIHLTRETRIARQDQATQTTGSGELQHNGANQTAKAQLTRSAPSRRAGCRGPAASRSPPRRYRCRDNRTRNRPGDRALPVARRRGFGSFTAKPRALSRHRRKPSGIGVPERVHFTEF